MSSTGGRPASICAAPASPRREAQRGCWSRFRPWEPRASRRQRPPMCATMRSRTNRRSRTSAIRRRRDPASCGSSTRRGDSAQRTRRLPLPWAPNAPRPGETVETLLRRTRLERGDELVRVIAARRTFSDIVFDWPLGGNRRRLIALSAAPQFGRHREFLGYRGFGVLGEEVDAPRPREGPLATGPAEAALLREATTLEPTPTPGAAPSADGSVAAPRLHALPSGPSRPSSKRRRRGAIELPCRPISVPVSGTAPRGDSRTKPRPMMSLEPSLTAKPADLSWHIARRLTPNISKLRRRPRLHSRRTEANPRRRCPRRARLRADASAAEVIATHLDGLRRTSRSSAAARGFP